MKKGGTLTLEFRRFALEGNDLTIYDSRDQAAKEVSFLSFENIAAIVPVKQPRSDSQLKVYLKAGATFDVSADLFKTIDARIGFYRHKYSQDDEEIENLYLALSDVVAIMPVSGLEGW